MTKSDKHELNQKQLIGLLLKYKDLVEKFINSSVKIKDFDKEYHLILEQIIEVHNQGYLLTRQGFRANIKNNPVPKERIAQELAFDWCCIHSDDRNLFLPLMREVQEHSVKKSINDELGKFSGKLKKGTS